MKQRYYLDGIEYKDGNSDQFFHSEGTVRADKDGQFKYSFVLRDHLGNTRVTFSDLNNDNEINEKEEIIQINNYYAFGLNMEGNWNGKDGANKYQYNGKELNDDFGLNWNDYGARFYDPAMARWQTVDPLSEKMRRHSPYNYCFDNPVRFIDPDGMAATNPDPIIIQGNNGTFKITITENLGNNNLGTQSEDATKATMRIQATYTPNDNQTLLLGFVQIIKDTQNGFPMKSSMAMEERKVDGWAIDRPQWAPHAWYGVTDDLEKITGKEFLGMKNSFGECPASFLDQPDITPADKTEFQVFVVDTKTGKLLDGFSWGYSLKDGKVVIDTPAKLDASSTSLGSPLDKAAQAWNTQAKLDNDTRKRQKNDMHKYKNDADQQPINLNFKN